MTPFTLVVVIFNFYSDLVNIIRRFIKLLVTLEVLSRVVGLSRDVISCSI